MSGSGISWATCKSAPRSRQITTPVPHHSVFYRPDALPAARDIFREIRDFFVNFKAFTFIYEGFRVLPAAFVRIMLFVTFHI